MPHRSTPAPLTAEEVRLDEQRARSRHWSRWGPYLSERAWGTVREDYSGDAAVWEYFPHDHARSRAYRWNEDGLGGICDRHQRICFGLALWNERDPFLKERLFGLTGNQGNHGEDVKEQYFYLDSTPTHSYMKWLYKYPQAAFPYDAPGRGEPPPGTRRAGVRAARHRRLRRPPLLRRVRRVRQGVAGRPPDRDHGVQSWPRPRPAAPAADGVVQEHLVVDRRGLSARRWPLASIPTTPPSPSTSRCTDSAGCTARARPRCSSPRTRPTANASSAAPVRASPRTASTTRSCTVGPTRSIPSSGAPRRPRTLLRGGARWRPRAAAPAPDRPGSGSARGESVR